MFHRPREMAKWPCRISRRISTMKRLRIPTVLFVLFLVACATSPTGRKQLMVVSEDSAIQSSAQAYTAQMGELQKEGKLSTDQALVNRVNAITGKLVSQAILM